MLIQTFKAEVIPIHIFANTSNIFINTIGTDRIFTTINLSSLSDTAAALSSAKTFSTVLWLSLLTQRTLFFSHSWKDRFAFQDYMQQLFLFIPFWYQLLFLGGIDTMFLTCKSPECTSMDGEWTESVVSAMMYLTQPTIYIPNSHTNLAYYTLGHTASMWQHMLQTFFFLMFHTVSCVAINLDIVLEENPYIISVRKGNMRM